MPANLTPEYLKAEQRYREASTPQEKLEALREMLRTLPKHKGTDKLQADLKRRISQARKEAAQAKKAGGYDPFAIARQGAGQVILIGPPNSGKSSIVARLTKAPVKIAEWPFSTSQPIPGMCKYEDVSIQLIDTPPLTAEHAPKGLAGAIRNADIIAVVVDAAADSALDDIETCLEFIRQRRLQPTSEPAPAVPEDPAAPLPKRCLIVANKCDLPAASDNLPLLRELLGNDLLIYPISTQTGQGVPDFPAELFRLLNVIRVYAKPPGKAVDKSDPFVLPAGSTVLDMARTVHRDLPETLKSARVWGTGVYDGQYVQHDHVLHDQDVVELHG